MCCLFIFLMVSFALQKLLSLIRSHFFMCVFIIFILGGGSKQDIAVIYVKEHSACVFLQEFYSMCPYIQVFKKQLKTYRTQQSSSEKNIYSNNILPQGRRKSSNKQPKLTLKTIRYGRTDKGQNQQKERSQKGQSRNK